MAEKIKFLPEDFDSVITYDMLVNYLIDIITDIRKNNNEHNVLIADIQKLEQLALTGFNTKKIQELLNIYNQIKKVSLQLRQKLYGKGLNLELYDTIEYVFYYNGKRYVTDKIDAKWLSHSNSKGLVLDLAKAEEDLKKQYDNIFENRVRELFNKHYEVYLQAISGMYRKSNHQELGQGRLNKGHVAEAYETHLSSHHSNSYNLLSNMHIDSSAAKAIIADENGKLGSKYWADYESPEEAWRHIRGALGTQRGTVAGDVGKFQVKQGNYSKNNQFSGTVRLSSIQNLIRGVKNYSDIINPDISVDIVAKKIATYLSERVNTDDKALLAHIANLTLADDINNINLNKLRTIHI